MGRADTSQTTASVPVQACDSELSGKCQFSDRQACHGHCCGGGHTTDPACSSSQQAQSHPLGFQVPTVQPMLEAWLENAKKEMAQKQEIMLQLMRMEMLQARPPILGRGACGLLPSF